MGNAPEENELGWVTSMVHQHILFVNSLTEHWLGECGITFSPYRTINEIGTVRPACSFISLSIVLYLT